MSQRASNSHSAVHSARPPKRKYTREQLLRNLQIIGKIPTPLPPDLPPSPPTSRSPSPAPRSLSKRKSEQPSAVGASSSESTDLPARAAKRARFTDHRDQATHNAASSASSASASRAAASAPSHPAQSASASSRAFVPSITKRDNSVAEDGELEDDDMRVTSAAPPSSLRHTQPAASSHVHTSSAAAASTSSSMISPPISSTSSSSAQPQPNVNSNAGATEQPSPSPSLLTTFMPVRRPRRGKLTESEFETLHGTYYSQGREFKYSGDRRYWSTFVPNHKHFKPLSSPPAPGTAYHTYGALMSRLEMLDALLCFVYSLWAQDHSKKRYNRTVWETQFSYLSWCKQKWATENITVREKAFAGLIYMIEAFINARKAQFGHAMPVDIGMRELVKTNAWLAPPSSNPANVVNPNGSYSSTSAPARGSTAPNGAAGHPASLGHQQVHHGSNPQLRTPPGMLPSPATLAGSSANSTPVSNPSATPNQEIDSNGTPLSTNAQGGSGQSGASSAGSNSSAIPMSMPPNGLSIPSSSESTTPPDVRVPTPLFQDIHEILDSRNSAAWCMKKSQETLTLPILREHFPKTFARMVFSTLAYDEEHEPEFEDEEGELFWPDQCITGEGLGWVCLMGKAMIVEFGKEFGYMGKEGIVPKPE